MKTVLVLAQHPELAETLQSGLSPDHYRVVHRTGVEDAEPLLAHGLAHICIVDVEHTGVQEIWILEKLRRRALKCPIIVYTGEKQWEWEEEAYLKGATHVLVKPLRIKMLTALLDRISADQTVDIATPSPQSESRDIARYWSPSQQRHHRPAIKV